MKKLRVLALMLEDFVPPESLEGLSEKQIAAFKTEYDVLASLEELGHAVEPLGVRDDLAPIRDAIGRQKPHVVFNLLEEFRGAGAYVPFVLGYLELIGQSYTGCNPRGFVLTHNKGLTKKILRYHRIPTPNFTIFARGRTIRRPARLRFPLIVKSTTEHGSVGIAQASVVTSDEKLAERVAFIHEQLGTDAIAEEYVDGREFYVGVIGNHRLQTFPIWELLFQPAGEGAFRIATERVKWDAGYQARSGVRTRAVRDLPEGVVRQIHRLCKRVYRILEQSGYARMDLRMAEDGRIFLIESNPNPQLAYGEDFSESAHAMGIAYNRLIQRILNLGLRYRQEGKA